MFAGRVSHVETPKEEQAANAACIYKPEQCYIKNGSVLIRFCLTTIILAECTTARSKIFAELFFRDCLQLICRQLPCITDLSLTEWHNSGGLQIYIRPIL
jgi:hypothetical protein